MYDGRYCADKTIGNLVSHPFLYVEKKDVQVYGMNLSRALRFAMCGRNFINVYE